MRNILPTRQILQMKRTITTLIIAICFLDCYSQDIRLILQYQKDENNTAWTKGIDQILIKNKHSIVSKILSDTNGVFIIPRSIISFNNSYDVTLLSIGMIENYLLTINSNSKDTITFSMPKKYVLRGGYAECPKCHRSNKVCKISTEPILIRKIINRDTVYSPISKRTYYSGTDVWHEFNPLWYCKRDSILF